MQLIPKNYADVEDTPAYKEAQHVGASVARSVRLEEYDHSFDRQEIRLLNNAMARNITFYLEDFFAEYRLQVGLEGYVREPESFVEMIRKLLLKLLWPQPPPPVKGTEGRPTQKLKLHLPSERQEEVLQLLKHKPQALAAAIQAAFARKLFSLMRVYRNNKEDGNVEIDELQKQYEKAMESIY